MARLIAAVSLVLFLSPEVWASAPTDALRRVFGEADKILTDPATAAHPLARFLAVRKLVNEAFDFRSAAELASGDHWRARTAAEQEEFTWLFSDLLERSFVARMASKANLERGMQLRYLGESTDRGRALVQTAMARRSGGEMRLDYELIERDGSWKIRDIAIDGVSMMANYRAQLDRVLGSASFPELLTQMRTMVGTTEPPAHPAARVDATAPADTVPPERGSLPVRAVSIVDAPLPVPVTSAVRPPARAHTTKAYWLQMMTARTEDEAGRLVSRLRDRKLPVAVVRTNARGKLTVNVRVGPYHNAEDAVLVLLDLQTRGHDPYLIAERE